MGLDIVVKDENIYQQVRSLSLLLSPHKFVRPFVSRVPLAAVIDNSLCSDALKGLCCFLLFRKKDVGMETDATDETYIAFRSCVFSIILM